MIVLNRLRATHFKQLSEVDLRFPPSGTLLIEGRNEAGKSSLFEAVIFALYGRPLIADRDYKIADLKQYGATATEVTLDFSIGERAFSITRRFGERHSARLTLPALDGGESETITIISEVEKRLHEELRLSADALLNTCFVEQKRLERLEDLNPSARLETINELLNLKVLTRLASDFKITSDERAQLKLAHARVEIAGLDDVWPQLEERAHNARRGGLFAQWREEAQQLQELQNQIADLEAAIEKSAARHREVENQMRALEALKRRLSTLSGELSFSVRAWREADNLHRQVKERLGELETLRAQLPAQSAQQEEYSGLAARLEQLENLERERVVLESEAQRTSAALHAHDQAQSDFDQTQKLLEERAHERDTAHAALSAAERALALRQETERRESALRLWLHQIENHESLLQRENEIAAQLQDTNELAAQQPSTQLRLEQAQQARALLTEESQNQHALDYARRDLENARRAQHEKDEYSARQARLENDVEAAQNQQRASEAAHRQASERMAQVETRLALEDWLAAHSQDVEESGSFSLQDVAERERQVKNELCDWESRVYTSRYPPNWIIVATPVVILLGFLLAHFLGFSGSAGGGLGVGLMVAWGSAIAVQNIRKAQAEYSRLKSVMDSLVGERRALEAQASLASRNAEREQKQREEINWRLSALDAPIPQSPAAAREQIAELDSSSLEEVRLSVQQGENDLQSAHVQQAVSEQALRNHQSTQAEEHEQALSVAACEQRLAGCEREQQRIATQIENLQLVAEAALGAALQEREASTLHALEDAARRQNEAAQNAHRRLSELEKERAILSNKREDIERTARETAQTLGFLSPRYDEEWASHAVVQTRAELAEMQQARQSVSDEELAKNVTSARSTLSALENQLSVLNASQEQRRATLEAMPRAELLADLQSAHDALDQSTQALHELDEVRAQINQRSLPKTSAGLMAMIAAQKQALQHARDQVALLPKVEQEVEAGARKLAAARQAFEEIWLRTFSGELSPPELEAAEEMIPARAARLQLELSSFNEADLQAQAAQFQNESSRNRSQCALLEEKAQVSRQKIGTLKAELKLDEQNSWNEVQAHFDELAESDAMRQWSAAQWEEEWQARREAVADNRSARRVRATALDLDDGVLDLAVERESRSELEESIAVKERAQEIVETTRASIVKRVMPLTMQNVRRLLPLLTESRYQDAEWDEAQNRILIYDAKARELVRKRTFSGGARDQISLALRLAFALATLPGEHNVRPGFLFLDEPLSSFDHARTQALVDLLTRGLIRKNFPQIFLISHSQSFDPALFDFRLQMEAGRVAQSTLP